MTQRPSSRFRNAAVENWGLKLLSFCIALALYSFVHSTPELRKTITTGADIRRNEVERLVRDRPVLLTAPSKARATPPTVDVRFICDSAVAGALKSLQDEQVVPRAEVRSPSPSGAELVTVDVSLSGCRAMVNPPGVVVRW